MGIATLRWVDRSIDETGQHIYRSESPIDLENLPPVLATVGPNIQEYQDTTVEEGKSYYYRVSSFNDKIEKFSEEIVVDTNYSIGVGSSELILGDAVSGFFGEVPATDLINGEDLSFLIAGANGMPGTLSAPHVNEPWLKFILDGKILYVHKKGIRHAVSWDQLNALDLVYGNRLIEINGYQYRIRLLKGADTDPSINTTGNFLEGSHNSEWSRLFYPLVRDDVNVPTRDPQAPYTNADLNMVWVDSATTPGAYSWCQEAHPGTTNGRVIRGIYGVSYLYRNTSSLTTASYGWRPVLELVL